MIGDDIRAALPQMQAQAESLMNATFGVQAPNDTTTVVNGFKRGGMTDKADTIGKIQAGSASSRDTVSRSVTVGGIERPVLEGGLHIPISSEVPDAGEEGVGWIYTCKTVDCEQDQSLVGRSYLVVSTPAKSYATARRLDVVEVPR